MLILKKILPLILCCLVAIATAQTDLYLEEKLPSPIENKAAWEEIVNGISLKEYVEDLEKEQENKKEENEKEKNQQKNEFEFGTPNPIVVSIMKFVLIAMGVGIIVFLLYKLIGQVNTPKNSRIKKGRLSEISLEEIEENIVEADLADFIQQAIEEEKYNLAIRLYYLLIIKELNANNLIQWKKDKTNRSYLKELSNTPFYENFKSVTQTFERIWYGRNKLNKNDFVQLEPMFKELTLSISSSKTAV